MHNSAQNLIKLNSDRAKKITFKRSGVESSPYHYPSALQKSEITGPNNFEKEWRGRGGGR